MKTEDRIRRCPFSTPRFVMMISAAPLIIALGCTSQHTGVPVHYENDIQTAAAGRPVNVAPAVQKETVEALIDALGDDAAYIRYYAAEVLGIIGDKRAVEPLAAALLDPDADVRRNAAGSLGLIGDKRAIKPLTRALRDDDFDVRAEAADALDALGWSPRGSIQEESYRIARTEERERSEIRNSSVRKYLSRLRDDDARVRVSAAEALDEIGWRPADEKEKIWYMLAKGEWSGGVKTDIVPVEKSPRDGDLAEGGLPPLKQPVAKQAGTPGGGLDIGYVDLRIKPGIVVDLFIDGKRHLETRGGTIAVPSGEHRLDVLDGSCNLYAGPITVKIKRNKTKKAVFKLRDLFPPLSKVKIDDLLEDFFEGRKIRNIKVVQSWKLSKTKYLVTLSFDYEGSAYYEFVPGNPYYAVPTRTVYPAGESGMVIFFSLEGFDLNRRDWEIKSVYYPPPEPSP